MPLVSLASTSFHALVTRFLTNLWSSSPECPSTLPAWHIQTPTCLPWASPPTLPLSHSPSLLHPNPAGRSPVVHLLIFDFVARYLCTPCISRLDTSSFRVGSGLDSSYFHLLIQQVTYSLEYSLNIYFTSGVNTRPLVLVVVKSKGPKWMEKKCNTIMARLRARGRRTKALSSCLTEC